VTKGGRCRLAVGGGGPCAGWGGGHAIIRGLGKRERESTPPPPVATHDIRGHTRTHTGRSTTRYDRETTTPRDRRFRFGGFSYGEKISSKSVTLVSTTGQTPVPDDGDNINIILHRPPPSFDFEDSTRYIIILCTILCCRYLYPNKIVLLLFYQTVSTGSKSSETKQANRYRLCQ